MKAQLKVDGGDGDLPSIPGISKPVRADVYPVDWNASSMALLLFCLLIGAVLPYFVLKIR